MSLALPCAMRAYKGTKWYKRLVCAEYAIALEAYPARRSIVDRSLGALPADDGRVEAYRRDVTSLFSAPESSWDGESPFGLLHRLRELKAAAFEASELDYRCLASARSPREARLDAETLSSIRSALSRAGRAVLIPDGDRPGEAPDLAAAVAERLLDGEPLRLALGPALGPWPEAVEHEPVLRLPAWWELDPGQLEALHGGGLVVCADLRYAYGFLALGLPVVTLLDDAEWFGAALNAESRASDDGLRYPASSAYGGLLRSSTRNGGGYRFRYWGAALPERERSGLYPLGGRLPSVPSRIPGSAGFYRRDDDWSRAEGPGEGVVHAACVIARALDVRPEFFESLTAPEDAPRAPGERAVYLSFNYYMTDNLLACRNGDGRDAPPWRRFMLDYLYAPRLAPGFESVPLYGKTLLGRTRSGRLFAGAFRPDGIRLLDGEGSAILRFDRGLIDRDDAALPGLYLPSGGARLVGAGRWCTTLVHDHAWDSRPGPVPVPSFGVVVVGDGPVPAEKGLRWDVEWAGLPCAKEEVDWLVGGFNALVEDGRDLCADDEAAARRLEAEGWGDTLSAETQETQLEAGVRQPRCCVGATTSGRVFALAVSGRSALSGGVTFSELSALARRLARERREALEFLVNLDGGASAMLYSAAPEGSALLSIPAPSDSNPAGVARKVPALLKIIIAEEP